MRGGATPCRMASCPIQGLIVSSREKVYLHDELNGPRSGRPVEYEDFNAFLYSLDTFIPVFDLEQESHWHPDAKGWLGFLLTL